MAKDDEKFDGLFMGAVQSAQGIDNFYDALFSFMRRKTDFFSNEEASVTKVQDFMEKHIALYKEDQKKQKLIQEKKDQEKSKKEQEKKANQPESGATIEEIDDEEVQKIELQELARKQKVAKLEKEKKKAEKKKEDKKEDKDKDGENEEEDEKKKEEENLKQKPNAGNGGQTDKYVWHQTLKEVTVYVTLPPNTAAKQLDVKLGIKSMHIKLKTKPDEPILMGEWFNKIHTDEALWSIERDGGKAILQITFEKHEGQNWWNCVLKGDIEIDTQKVEPENSKLSDLDGETRQTVEKMMYDQQQKAAGKPTSEEQEKQGKMKAFMDAHPEMDFSKAKFC